MTREIQVYEGDGLSDEERERQELLGFLKAKKTVDSTAPKKLKTKWTVDSQQDFSSLNGPDLEDQMKLLRKKLMIPKEMIK